MLIHKDAAEIELLLRKVKNAALIAAFIFLLLAIFALSDAIKILPVFIGAFEIDKPQGYLITDSIYMGIPFMIRGFVAIVLLGICSYMAYRIYREESPFTEQQAKIAKISTCIAIGLAAFEYIWGPVGNCFNLLFDNGLIYISTTPNPFDPIINQYAIVAAAVLFLYSVVLKYGTILQDNSDMTV